MSSTGYGWEGIRQVCATLLGVRHVPERHCGGTVAALRCGKAVQMHCQFVVMHCQLHCLYFRIRK